MPPTAKRPHPSVAPPPEFRGDARFAASVMDIREAPPAAGRPRVALVGRSNVGKSSLINSLLQRKQLAQTSNTPGKTRRMHFYEVMPINHVGYWWIDLPGYGYASLSKSQQASWRAPLEKLLIEMDAVLQCVDIRHPPKDTDRMMGEWLAFSGLDRWVILTKADEIPKAQWAKQAKLASEVLRVDPSRVIIYCARTHLGFWDAWSVMDGLTARSSAEEPASPSA